VAFASFSCEVEWRLKGVFVTGWAVTMVDVTVMDGNKIKIKIERTVTADSDSDSGRQQWAVFYGQWTVNNVRYLEDR
jgi:hypothetical protein